VKALAALAVVAACGAALPSPAAPGSPAPRAPRRLIEMGWDEPDPGFMRRHLAQLESSPFDGCVYHLFYETPAGREPGRFTWEAWGTRAFTEAEIDSGLRDLMATRFKRFRWNFLRMNVTPGNLDWFDDYSAVLSNARLAASVARRGRSAGIFLDTESYEHALFQYPAQRDTAKHGFEGYAAQARRRGAEVMRAFEQGYPGLTVFLTVGPSYPYIQWLGDKIRLDEGRYGLVPAFVDGMISAASDSARIVDGNEASYPVKNPDDLQAYVHHMTHGVLPWLSDSTRYRRVVSRSFGIWLDHDWRHRPWDLVDPSKSYRPPAALRAVVRRALELADDYVWVYSETPRWWTEAGGRKALPEAYVQALREARKGLAP
jgi:hypothetical protein